MHTCMNEEEMHTCMNEEEMHTCMKSKPSGFELLEMTGYVHVRCWYVQVDDVVATVLGEEVQVVAEECWQALMDARESAFAHMVS